MFRVAIITASDKGYAGERADESGEVIAALCAEAGYAVVSRQIFPDDRIRLANALRTLCDKRVAELILTTGGTGFSLRDVTPEATLDVAERLAPGIAEAMRQQSLAITPRAMLSRGVAALRGQSLIVNLPGSPKAVRENLGFILPALWHGLEILTGSAGECAAPQTDDKGGN